MFKKHLAIFSKIAAESILSGKKTVETRFSKNKIIPFSQVEVGDIVFIKISGQDIIGQFIVKKVFFMEGIDLNDLEFIFDKWGTNISVGNEIEDKKYYNSKLESRFGTIIFINKVERLITSPVKFRKNDMRGWVIIND